MAASGTAAPRQPRRGPAPIASFDHDGSDESSPESKIAPRLPEIRETPAAAAGAGAEGLAPGEHRARSHSTPAASALAAPAAPRIDISRASSSSHHDSRDSSPELALFAGGGGAGGEDARHRLELGFREDGALDLRSSTEELSFLEPAPGETRAPAPAAPPSTVPPPPPPLAMVGERRHSRKDSQSSEVALLGVSGRTSRLSSVGSQGSAVSAVSRVSRLSVVSGASRSPSPHRMLLETSFCGPKPIETDPEACAAAVAEHILDIVKLGGEPPPAPTLAPVAAAPVAQNPAVDARDHREVRTEAMVESVPARAPLPPAPAAPEPRPEERRARPRVRREPSEPEVYKTRNRSKDIIRIKLKPDEEDVDEEESEQTTTARPPASLALSGSRGSAGPGAAPASPRRRSPSPNGTGAGAPVSRKSSFCSLFKSRETIASPESPASEALRRKRSLTDGRSRDRSKSRERPAPPAGAGTAPGKLRGSVLSLFRTPRRSLVDRDPAPPSPASRDHSPHPTAASNTATAAAVLRPGVIPGVGTGVGLKYYEDTRDGIIHIPLRTPPDESGPARRGSGGEPSAAPHPRDPRPASAPAPRALPDLSPVPAVSPGPPAPPAHSAGPRPASKPLRRTVLPDGTIIIPLHSPTERTVANGFPEPSPPASASTPPVRSTEPACSGESDHNPTPPPAPPRSEIPGASGEDARRRRKERLVFTTQVGSREQVFSTQFSITKTPSVTSEISGSFPSFAESEPAAPAPAPVLRDSYVGAGPADGVEVDAGVTPGSAPATPQDPPRDSSESEPSSETAPPRAGNDVERRGLVVEGSFEEELPYVPTTLPQERTAMVPMVPVRERGGVRVASVQRPRGSFSAGGPRVPPPAPTPPPPPVDKLRIKLPRRPRPAPAPASASSRSRTRSGSETGETRPKQEWIDFEEVPERRKQPKRIQTLPAGATTGASGGGGGGVVFSYVEPEQCRCECHTHAAAGTGAGAGAPPDDRRPLLDEDARISTSSAEGGDGDEEHVVPECAPAPPPPSHVVRHRAADFI